LNHLSEGDNLFQGLDQIDTGQRLIEGFDQVVNRGLELFETEIQTGHSTKKWFALRASRLTEKFESLVITLQDITIRKKVENALEESLSSYRNIYNKTPVMMHSIDQNGVLVSVSDFWLEKLGYKRHEVIGRPLSDFLTEDSRRDARLVMPVFFERGSIYDVSYHFVTRDGQILETLLSAIEEGKGTENARSLAVVTDVTALKETERELKKSRQALLEAQSLARVGNYELDMTTGFFISSRVFDEILEISDRSEKHYKILEEIVDDKELSSLEKALEHTFTQGGQFKYEGKVRTLQTRRELWLEGLGNVILNDEGLPVRLIGTIQDITASKIAEIEIQKLTERLKMAMQSAGIGVWEQNNHTGQVHFEPEVYDLFHLDFSQTISSWEAILERVMDEDKNLIRHIQHSEHSEEDLTYQDFRARLSDGLHYFRMVTRQLRRSAKDPGRLVGVIMDVTKDQLTMQSLEASLLEKDT
jgi:PAS domain S-box-containing protein